MYRLAELTQSQRKRLGWALMVGGALLLVVAVWWIHYSSFARTTLVDGVETPVIVDYFNWVPRGWYWKALGYVAAFAASQMLLLGAALAFVVGRRMTWALASFLAFLAWIELVLIFGIVPSEWLNLSQTDLDWSPQRIFVSIPSWLVLGNQVDISFAALKDIISMGYHVVMLGAAAVFAYKIQDFGKPRKAPEKVTQISPYGRPLIRSGD
ncbi:MAG TPA: hypothetical protein VJ815_06270 [Acidimicrobiia bacterium]|nr:hypothetical protein [Acidimicrobiia bacterium]